MDHRSTPPRNPRKSNAHVSDDDAFPEDVVPWDEVKAAVRSRLGR